VSTTLTVIEPPTVTLWEIVELVTPEFTVMPLVNVIRFPASEKLLAENVIELNEVPTV
jgi:hypothetical protein